MKFSWRGAIGPLISAVLVWWLVTRSGIQWHEAWLHIRAANPWLLLLSSAASTVIFAIRAPRWRIILPPLAPPIRFRTLWEAITIGQMATNVLPFRAGELARAYVLTREDGRVPFSTSFASVVVDRLFDGIVLLLFLLLAMLDPAFPAGARVGEIPVARLAILPAVGLVVGIAGLCAIVFRPEMFIGIFRTVARRIVPRFEERGADMLARFAEGLSVLRSPRRFALVFVWTVAHWLVTALSFWLGFEAIGLEAPVSATLFAVAVVAMGVAVPSTPGFVGVFETAAIGSLVVYGVSSDMAGAWAVVYHGISWLPVTVIGLAYFARLGLSLAEIKKAGSDR